MAWGRARRMSAACCACCNRATSAVTRRGCCSARWWRLADGAVEGRGRGLDRRQREWRGGARERRRQSAALAAIGQRPQLRHLGAVRFGGGHRGDGAGRDRQHGRPAMNLLTLVLIMPLVGFLASLTIPRRFPQNSRAWALAVSLATFAQS